MGERISILSSASGSMDANANDAGNAIITAISPDATARPRRTSFFVADDFSHCGRSFIRIPGGSGCASLPKIGIAKEAKEAKEWRSRVAILGPGALRVTSWPRSLPAVSRALHFAGVASVFSCGWGRELGARQASMNPAPITSPQKCPGSRSLSRGPRCHKPAGAGCF